MLALNPVSLKGGPLAVAGDIKKASQRVELFCSITDESLLDQFQNSGDVGVSYRGKKISYREAFESLRSSHTIDHAPHGTQDGHRIFESFAHSDDGTLDYSRYETIDGVPVSKATYSVDEKHGMLETRMGNSISVKTLPADVSLPDLSADERSEVWNITR